MTPELISLKEGFTAAQALERIRYLAKNTETIYYLYVTNAARRLTGTLSLRDLVTADPQETIGEIMTRDAICVHTDTDQEEVSRLSQRYDFLAVPGVDREQRLGGIVTVDDVIDIIQQETTEDIYALGGGVQSGGDGYFQSNLFSIARKRVVWLFVLLLTNTVTGTIIKAEEDILQKVVTLAAFIPLLTGTGGNVGAQSSTVVIRGDRYYLGFFLARKSSCSDRRRNQPCSYFCLSFCLWFSSAIFISRTRFRSGFDVCTIYHHSRRCFRSLNLFQFGKSDSTCINFYLIVPYQRSEALSGATISPLPI